MKERIKEGKTNIYAELEDGHLKKPVGLMILSIYSLLLMECNFRNRRKWPREEHFPEEKHTTFSEKPKSSY